MTHDNEYTIIKRDNEYLVLVNGYETLSAHRSKQQAQAAMRRYQDADERRNLQKGK